MHDARPFPDDHRRVFRPGRARARCSSIRHILTDTQQEGSVIFLRAKEYQLQIEYRFLPLKKIFHEPPADMSNQQ